MINFKKINEELKKYNDLIIMAQANLNDDENTAFYNLLFKAVGKSLPKDNVTETTIKHAKKPLFTACELTAPKRNKKLVYLTKQQKKEVYCKYMLKQKNQIELAEEYGVSQPTISHIIKTMEEK